MDNQEDRKSASNANDNGAGEMANAQTSGGDTAGDKASDVHINIKVKSQVCLFLNLCRGLIFSDFCNFLCQIL